MGACLPVNTALELVLLDINIYGFIISAGQAWFLWHSHYLVFPCLSNQLSFSCLITVCWQRGKNTITFPSCTDMQQTKSNRLNLGYDWQNAWIPPFHSHHSSARFTFLFKLAVPFLILSFLEKYNRYRTNTQYKCFSNSETVWVLKSTKFSFVELIVRFMLSWC